MCLKNFPGVCRFTSLKFSFVQILLEIQDPLWIPFLFLTSVAFIWYILCSQQMLSFHAVNVLKIQRALPSYTHYFIRNVQNKLFVPFRKIFTTLVMKSEKILFEKFEVSDPTDFWSSRGPGSKQYEGSAS